MTRLAVRDWPTVATTLARTFGVRGFFLRAEHELRRRVNAFRAAPREILSAAGTPLAWLAVDSTRLAEATDRTIALERAARIEAGEYEAFRHSWRTLPRDAGGWHKVDGAELSFPADAAWWHIPHLSRLHGDIKIAWEPARFTWAYDLVRAYRAFGREESAEAFFHTLEQWAAANPPFRGVHWSCGQEVAIRATALLYAEANVSDSRAATSERRALLAQILAWSSERIADGIGYAISQRNNHALSEALGLALLGERLRGVTRTADARGAKGRRLFDRLVREQFAIDGWYIQHSFTYMRLALDQVVVMQRLLDATGQHFSKATIERIAEAFALLATVTDRRGDVPNHGANDGAFIHPVTQGAYRDFRPSLTSLASTLRLPLRDDIVIDAEPLAWMGASMPLRAPAPVRVLSGASGWLVARHRRALLFLRAGRYRSRPSHLDRMHVDLRVDEKPLLVDAGTFTYNGPPPWTGGLGGSATHNGPIVDGREPGVRGPRFLWLRWPSADINGWRETEDGVDVAASSEDVERIIRLRDDYVEILDRPLLTGRHRVHVSWLLAPGVSPECIESSAERIVTHAQPNAVKGWVSWYYGDRTQSVAVDLDAECTRDEPLRTIVRFPSPIPARLDEE